MKHFLDCMIEGLARFGCGMVGLAYPHDYEEPTLGTVVVTGASELALASEQLNCHSLVDPV
jgi:hypothetical protein